MGPPAISLPRNTPANMIALGMLRAIIEKEGSLTPTHIISRILSLRETTLQIMAGLNFE